jgi:hypothetical protein
MKSTAGIILALALGLTTTAVQATDWTRIVGTAVIGAVIVNQVKGTPQYQHTETTNYNVWGTQRHPDQRPIYNQHGEIVGHTWANQGGSSIPHPAVVYNTVERARMFADPQRGGQYLRENLEMGRLPRW